MSAIEVLVDGDGHLLIRSRTGVNASIRLVPDGGTLAAPGVEPVTLPWRDYGTPRWETDGPALDRWAIEHFASGRAGSFGIAVRVSGRHDQAAAAIRHRTTTWWRRLNTWWESGTLTGHVIPVHPGTSVASMLERERQTLDVLCTVIATRPDLQHRLGDRGRMTQLAGDLVSGARRMHAFHEGLSGAAVDVVVAMRRAGLEFPYSRPLSPSAIKPLDEVTTRIRAALLENPHRVDRVPNEALITKYARENHVDVEPWPFSALVD